MKTILRSDIPRDFSYYRTGSRVFYEYYQKFTTYLIRKIWTGYEFLLAFRIIPGFWSITVEKSDTEITRKVLDMHDISHGIVFWTPMRLMEKPAWWWRVPTWLMKRNIHSSRSAFSVLDREDYWNKWSSNARAHRKRVLWNITEWIIHIDKNATVEDFLAIYKSAKIHDPNKLVIYKMTKRFFEWTDIPHRVYIVYVDNKPLAGALFIDEWVTSEYWASFYTQESHPYHLWIAIMDAWFADSYRMGIKYCDLDHMRDSWQSWWFAGYTKFKSSIADHDVYFHDMWIKVF